MWEMRGEIEVGPGMFVGRERGGEAELRKGYGKRSRVVRKRGKRVRCKRGRGVWSKESKCGGSL